MKRTQWILAVLSIGILCAALWQWQAASGLEALNNKLRAEQTPKSEAPDAVQVDQDEKVRLEEENRDLLKLRNQVRQLRDQVKQLGGARAENDRLHQIAAGAAPAPATLPTPKGFTPRESLADAGTGSPEAAIQSFFWAMREGNLDRFMQTVSPQFLERHTRNLPPAQIDQYLQRLQVMMQEQMKSFSNFRVVGQEQKGPDRLVLQLQSSASSKVAQMNVRLFGNEWRVEDPF